MNTTDLMILCIYALTALDTRKNIAYWVLAMFFASAVLAGFNEKLLGCPILLHASIALCFAPLVFACKDKFTNYAIATYAVYHLVVSLDYYIYPYSETIVSSSFALLSVLLNFAIMVSLARNNNPPNTGIPQPNFINPMVYRGNVASYGGLY